MMNDNLWNKKYNLLLEMERLIEIFRRFSMAIIWIIGIIISTAIIIAGFNSNENLIVIFGVICILITFLVSKLVNWIFGN